ncbi:MAG: MoaD/ThiS family protein [Tissierellia bacterium]|nr:MoaD/ThiS family protein [Tissierellia bacterium]
MVKVEVRLFATFREGREKKQFMELKEGTNLSQIIDTLNINKEEVSIALINGIDGPLDREVADGDIVALFPPVGGG